MSKTRKNYKNKNGGKVIASGGYGCVFKPALQCKNSKKRDANKITKLMTTKHAKQEYEQINNLKNKLHNLHNFEDYFLLYDATLCHPAKLTTNDMESFEKTCSALPKDGIKRENVNDKLDEIMALNLPNGGLPIDDYIYQTGSFEKMHETHIKMIELLKNGIIPMNEKNIYHNDIKDSNILIGQDQKVRLIDWGLAVEYKKNDEFPRNWRNRPLQFNVPFSVVIFTDAFYEKYSKYLKEKNSSKSLKPFVIDYLTYWMKERGAGHYRFINEIIYKLYANDFSHIAEKDRPKLIETEFTMPIIINYIVDVLEHFTKFKQDGSLNLREYLNEVYIKIVDIWGFISSYYPILEMLFNNYNSLTEEELLLFHKLRYIYEKYLFNPRHEPIIVKDLINDLNQMANIMNTLQHEYLKSNASNETKSKTKSKTQKLRKKSPLFKRKKLIKRFKNPILLSFK